MEERTEATFLNSFNLITSVLQGTLFFRNKKLNLGPAVKKQVSFELNMSTVYIS